MSALSLVALRGGELTLTLKVNGASENAVASESPAAAQPETYARSSTRAAFAAFALDKGIDPSLFDSVIARNGMAVDLVAINPDGQFPFVVQDRAGVNHNWSLDRFLAENDAGDDNWVSWDSLSQVGELPETTALRMAFCKLQKRAYERGEAAPINFDKTVGRKGRRVKLVAVKILNERFPLLVEDEFGAQHRWSAERWNHVAKNVVSS